MENGFIVGRPVRRLFQREMIVQTTEMAEKWKEVELSESYFGFGAAGSRSGEILKKILQVSGLIS